MRKEIEEDTREWKALPCSWIVRLNIIKMSILPKAVYRYNVIQIRIQIQFFTDLERRMFNDNGKAKNSQYPKKKKSSTIKELPEASPCLTSKIYHRATLMKIALY